MKKNSIIIYVVLAILGSLISCQQENDENIYEYTAEQKAEIQSFADKYGLHIKFIENTANEPLMTPIAVKHFFRSYASMIGKTYPIVFNNENGVSYMEPEKKLMTKTSVEVGSWSDILYGSYCGFKVVLSKDHSNLSIDISPLYNSHYQFVKTYEDMFEGVDDKIVVDVEGELYNGGLSVTTYFYGTVDLYHNYGSIAVWNELYWH